MSIRNYKDSRNNYRDKIPFVSYIVPVYNKEMYIEQCVTSIEKNGIDSYEIIIIDDGSTDNSLSLVNELKKNNDRIKCIKQNNKGVSAARNLGIKKAKGKYIQFVDSDDLLKSNYLIEIRKIIENSEVDIIFFDYLNFYSYDEIIEEIDPVFSFKELELFDIESLFNKYILHNIGTKIYRREVIQNLFFNEKISLYEDISFCLNTIMQSSKMIYIDKKIYFYRRNVLNSLSNHTCSDTRDCLDFYIETVRNFLNKYSLNPELFYKNIFGCICMCLENSLLISKELFNRNYYHFNRLSHELLLIENVFSNTRIKKFFVYLFFKSKCFAKIYLILIITFYERRLVNLFFR